MTLAEWRAALDGFARSADLSMRRLAWQVSLQLMAAGCHAEDVSVAKLLGEPKRERREQTEAQKRASFERRWKQVEKRQAAAKE